VPDWFNLRPEEELGSAVAAKEELTGDGRDESDSSRGRSPQRASLMDVGRWCG
jgi:hypothetical protein